MTEAETYLERMGEPLRQLEMMVWTGNPVLDSAVEQCQKQRGKRKKSVLPFRRMR